MNPPASKLPELVSFSDSLPEPRIVVDFDYRILSANPAYLRAFSPGQPVTGRRCYEDSHRYAAPCNEAGESCQRR